MADSRVSKLLLEVKADLKDLKNLRAELLLVEKEAKKTSTGISEGLKGAFAGIAAGATAYQLKGIFDSAVKNANQYEVVLLGLNATAKLTGNNFAQLKGSVTKLSEDGVLSLNQASTAMKTLLAQGIKADKAFELLEASKKVGAFNNIVGDTGQAVADFVKFLQTGSAELAENLDPSIVKVVKSLGGYEKVASDAGAKQKLINSIIEKGGKLTGDYNAFLETGAQAAVRFEKSQEALSRTIGQKLQPAYAALYKIGIAVLGFFTSFIGSLDATGVSIIAFSTLAVISIAAIGKSLVSVGLVAGTTWAAILGPITLIIAGIAAIGVVVNALYQAFKKGEGQKLLEEQQQIKDQIAALEKQKGKTKELNEAKAQLAKTSKALIDLYGPYLKQLGLENANYETKLGLIKKLDDAKKRLGGDDRIQGLSDSELVTEITKAQDKKQGASQGTVETTYVAPFLDKTFRGAKDVTVRKNIGAGTEEARQAEQDASGEEYLLDQEQKKRKTKATTSTAATAGTGKEARFIEAQRKIEEIVANERYTIAIATNSKISAAEKTRRIENAKRDAETAAENEISALRQAYAEYIEDKYTADQEALTRSTNDVKRASEEALGAEIALIEKQRRADLLAAARNVDEIAEINRQAESELYDAKKENLDRLRVIAENNARKLASLQAKSLEETVNAAGDIVKGASSLTRSRNLGEAFSGAGGLTTGVSKLPGLGFLGNFGAVGTAIGGFASTITDLFGKSDEDRAREAEDQAKRDEEAKRILQLQANYTKTLVDLGIAQAKLPFEDLQRQLRLVDIQTSKDKLSGIDSKTAEANALLKKKGVISGVLASESGKIAEGSLYGDVTSTAEGLTGFLSKTAAQAPQIAAAIAYTQATQAENSAGYNNGAWIIGALSTLNGFDIPPQMRDQLIGILSQQAFANLRQTQVTKGINQRGANTGIVVDSANTRISDASAYGADIARKIKSGEYRIVTPNQLQEERRAVEREVLANSISAAGGTILGSFGNIETLQVESQIDIDRAQQLLTVIEQGQQIDLQIRDNTGQTAENTAKLTQLDDRRSSFLDLGNRQVFSQGLSVDVNKLQIPSGAASVVLGSSVINSVDASTVSKLSEVVDLINESNEYLAIIAANTDNRAGTNTADFDNYLINKLAQIRSRRVS